MSGRNLTPTQSLIMELLAARARLGEDVWPIDSRLTPSVVYLAEKGLVGWKRGIVERTVLARLTDEARSEYLSDTYVAPLMSRFEALRRRCDTFTRASCREPNSGRRPGARYAAESYCDPCELARAIDGTAR